MTAAARDSSQAKNKQQKKQYRHRYRVLVKKKRHLFPCDISKQIGIMSSNCCKHVVWSPLDRQGLMFRLLSFVTGACRHRCTVFIKAPDSHFWSRDQKKLCYRTSLSLGYVHFAEKEARIWVSAAACLSGSSRCHRMPGRRCVGPSVTNR